ncbi:hypothetical protein RYX36_009096 [Vicia faba]
MQKVWSLQHKFCNHDLEAAVEVKPAICSLFLFDTSFKRENKNKNSEDYKIVPKENQVQNALEIPQERNERNKRKFTMANKEVIVQKIHYNDQRNKFINICNKTVSHPSS